MVEEEATGKDHIYYTSLQKKQTHKIPWCCSKYTAQDNYDQLFMMQDAATIGN